jgi:hypothetical protein
MIDFKAFGEEKFVDFIQSRGDKFFITSTCPFKSNQASKFTKSGCN